MTRKICACLVVVAGIAEVCLHNMGIHSGIEGVLPMLSNYASTVED